MFAKILRQVVVFGGGIFGCVSLTQAQTPGTVPLPNYQSYLSDSTRNYLNPTYNRPTISPYLSLVPQVGNGGTIYTPPAGIYQSFIKPQVDLQDQRFRQSITAQNQPYSPSPVGPGFQSRSQATTGFSYSIRPTGHAATYMNTSHYYPGERGHR